MIAGIAAVTAAVTWGASDFCGGKASQAVDARAVVLISQVASLPLLALGLALTASGWPAWADLGWALAAGAAGALGLVLLYQGLATGAMSVVAPVTAVTAAVVPVAAGLALHGSPGGAALFGVGCAVVAIVLVTMGSGGGRASVSGRVVGLALAAGCGFGLFYSLLAQTSPEAEMWPLLAVRVATLAVSGALVWQAGAPLRLSGQPLWWAMGAGMFDVVANAAYLVATYTGLLSVVAPIASLYPVSTVALALAVDRERLRAAQCGAIAVAALSLVLVNL